jgi:hypothetical protein
VLDSIFGKEDEQEYGEDLYDENDDENLIFNTTFLDA